MWRFAETGGVFGYTVDAARIEYRDQAGTLVMTQTWDATNIASAWGGSNRIRPSETREWAINMFWNPPVTRLTARWSASIRDDQGNASNVAGESSADMPN